MNGFLQEYGLNIVAVIIVLAFIVFASVFGDTITTGVKDITSDFFAKSGVTADVNGGDDDSIDDDSGDENSGDEIGGGDTDDNVIGGDVTKNTITFTINGETYQAEEGMLWKDWVVSDYNTNNYTIKMGGIYTGNDDYYVHTYNTRLDVTGGSNEIIANHSYIVRIRSTWS